MAVIKEGIIANTDGSISFGNYEAAEKIKVNDFEHGGAIYSVRTHKDVTRLERNNDLLFEAVPGAAVFNFEINEQIMRFDIEGAGSSQLTICLEPSAHYMLTVCKEAPVDLETGRASGKINYGVMLSATPRRVVIKKV